MSSHSHSSVADRGQPSSRSFVPHPFGGHIVGEPDQLGQVRFADPKRERPVPYITGAQGVDRGHARNLDLAGP
jgi:hypothetical protein